MDEAQIKNSIASRLAYYRKLNNMTQTELAEKINYSDKSVSKWERGDGLPDVCVLMQIAELFGITINDLIYETEEPKKLMENFSAYRKKKIVFTYILSIGLVFLVASIAFVLLKIIIPDFDFHSFAFLVAVPVSCIVTLSFSCIWKNLWIQFLSTSGIVWGITLCLFTSIKVNNIQFLFVIAGVLQFLAICWFIFRAIRFRHKNPKTK